MKAGLVAAVLALAAGCASVPPPTVEELKTADYGEKPTQHNELIGAYFAARLKDAASAKLQANQPEHGYYRESGFKFQKKPYKFAWMVTAIVNAKNSFGAYTGFKQYKFFFRGEQIVFVVKPAGG